jgi:hypothetical protein
MGIDQLGCIVFLPRLSGSTRLANDARADWFRGGKNNFK